jgi:hypothetical protein
MVFVNGDGTILRCFNAATGSTSGNCGFTATHIGPGVYDVNFGFSLTDRFFTLSVNNNVVSVPNRGVGINFPFTFAGELRVHVFQTTDSALTDRPFIVIVH